MIDGMQFGGQYDYGIDGPITPVVARLRCPRCHDRARLEVVGDVWFVGDVPLTAAAVFTGTLGVGVRYCPNEECRQVIVITYTLHANEPPKVISVVPPESLPLDTTNLPGPVLASIREAATCFGAGCYRAAAIMLRRTLEEVCDDRNAQGGNLYQRVEALTVSGGVPPDLAAGLHDLRLLGNDAAHFELKDYDDIGPDEVTAAFELVTEVLKALYQYASVVAKLVALKKSLPAAKSG